MTSDTKKHCEKHFFPYCLQCFSSAEVLEFHVKNCIVIDYTKSVLLPEENEYVDFQNFKRLIKTPFIIYGDFKCALIPSLDNIDFGPNTKRYQSYCL